MSNVRCVVSVAAVIVALGGQLKGGVVSGVAVDLNGVPLRNFDLTVTLTDLQGRSLTSVPPTINKAAASYSVTVDPNLVRQSGAVIAILNVSAGATRLGATVQNIAVVRDLTIDVVLPKAPPMMYQPPCDGYRWSGCRHWHHHGW